MEYVSCKITENIKLIEDDRSIFHAPKSRCSSLIFKFQYSDMNDEMRTEAMELCVTACEKFSANNEVCLVY